MRIARLTALCALATTLVVGACAQGGEKTYTVTEVSPTEAVVRAHVVEVSTSTLNDLADMQGFSSLRHSYFVNDKGERRIVPSLEAIMKKGPSWQLSSDQNTVSLERGVSVLDASSDAATKSFNVEIYVKRWTDVTDGAGDTYAFNYRAAVNSQGEKEPLSAEGTALLRAGTPYVRVLRNNKDRTTLLFIEAGRHFFTETNAPAYVAPAPVVIEEPAPVVVEEQPVVVEEKPVVVEEPVPVVEERKTIGVTGTHKLAVK